MFDEDIGIVGYRNAVTHIEQHADAWGPPG